MGPAPDDLAASWAVRRPHPQLAMVRHQVAQERVDRAQLGKLAKDQAPDGLHLLIWVPGDLARGALDIAHGQGDAQRPATRFGQQALAHPLLHEM